MSEREGTYNEGTYEVFVPLMEVPFIDLFLSIASAGQGVEEDEDIGDGVPQHIQRGTMKRLTRPRESSECATTYAVFTSIPYIVFRPDKLTAYVLPDVRGKLLERSCRHDYQLAVRY